MVKSIPTYIVLLRSYCVWKVENFPPFGHNNFSTRQRTWEWTSPLFFWDQARVKWHITCPPSHLKFQSWVQDGGRGTHVTHFVQLYPQPLYTASQVRTTSRLWDKGVLTDLCLTCSCVNMSILLWQHVTVLLDHVPASIHRYKVQSVHIVYCGMWGTVSAYHVLWDVRYSQCISCTVGSHITYRVYIK